MTYPFPEFDGPDRPTFWRPADIIALLCRDGFMSPDDWRPITFAAVVMAESAGSPLATGTVIWAPGKVTHLSVDLGMFQLNSYYATVSGHYPGSVGPITTAECFNPFTAWDYTWLLLNKERTGWSYNMQPWVAWKTGAYDKYVTACYRGMLEYREVMDLGKGPF